MLHPEDRSYYSCRMVEEVERGDQAIDPTAAAIHYELAYRYGLLSSQCVAGISQIKPTGGAMFSSTPREIHYALEAA